MSGVFDALPTPPQDQIIRLMGMYRDDPRTDKVDLGVGVYRNAQGVTPVMRAIKRAEEQLWQQQDSKAYTDLAGDIAYRTVMAGLVLGGDYDPAHLSTLATVGGTGAIYMAARLVQMTRPDATVWISDPTWPNHPPILSHVGLAQRSYRYFDAASRSVDFGAMMADLAHVAAGDVVLLHGCCHNPTGANLTLPEWQALADLLADRGAVPLIDLAYQGFGDGLEADAAPTRLIAQRCETVLIAASCSKNFGLYRERAGALLVLGSPNTRDAVQSNLTTLNRLNYSFPPDHGARLVTMVLSDPELRTEWQAELEEMRTSMLQLRQGLARQLRDLTGSDRFGFLAQHRGMFSRLGATPAQVEQLRQEHGLYIIGDSRMNIAGLTQDNLSLAAQAIAACDQ